MFGRSLEKFVKIFVLRDIWTITTTRPPFQIRSLPYLKTVAVDMASCSATEHKCRRLDGKVAVVTASTAGCVIFIIKS